VQLHPLGCLVDQVLEEGDEVLRPVESLTQPATVPSCTSRAAKSMTVPLRRYSNSRRTGMPGWASSPSPVAGTAGRVGLTRLLAWMPVFSSTDHTRAFSGGSRYSPHTSPAFSQKSGSWLVIQDWTCHGLRSSARQIRHACEAEMDTPSSAMRSANADIVQRDAASGGSSVTVLTSRSTSSWP